MKIRVKIKHLVVTGVAFALFLPICLYLIQPQISIYMAERQMAKGELAGKEKILELIDNGKIFTEQRFALIREYMIEGAYSMEYDVYVGTTSTYWSDTNQAKVKFSMEERLPYLLEYVEKGPTDGYFEEAAIEVASHYNQQGGWGKGDQVLQTAMDRTQTSYFRSELATEQIELAVRNEEYDIALSYLENFYENVYEEDTYMKMKADKSHVEILLHKGEDEEALALAEKTLAGLDGEDKEGKNDYVDLPLAEKQLRSLVDRIVDGEAAFRQVSGKIFENENGQRPLEGVGVFLREKNNLYYSIGPEEQYKAVTDENGEYAFFDVPPGSYQLFYGFTFDQIDGFTIAMPANPWIEVKGKDVVAHDTIINPLMEIHQPVNSKEIIEDQVHFSWEPVEEAAYYSISVGREVEGGTVSHHLKNGIKSPGFIVSKEELHYSQGGIQFTEESDWKEIDYSSVLGFADPRGRFFWNVQAYNAKGDLITQSQGYRLGEDTFGNLPMFYLKNRELTEADKVLLKNKPEEALEMYKENFTNDPGDLHSLLMISKIIGVEASVLNKTSKELAMPYLEELAQKSPNETIFYDILEYYYEKKDWQTYEKWYKEFEGTKEDILNEYIEGNRAMALMKQGKYEEARTHFQLVMEQGHRHEYIGEWIALELYLGTPMKLVEELGRQHPEQGIYEVRIDWERLIKNLQREKEQFDGYEDEVKRLTGWFVNEETDAMEAWIASTDKVELKRFAEELRK
ncbi:hypothetical protein AB685_10520 [Bacillus sp. LL01]|uniref:hypothetical protein n=1 Tax=Bacillus sp. LL01 TaxID=1665556 RepID=UPI00064D6E2E|nr:hypothetical protein [Bacillus sp. LL01]KMJ58329.1 hypothetical protein AB685_10520 [Bacillus sp. LL01]